MTAHSFWSWACTFLHIWLLFAFKPWQMHMLNPNSLNNTRRAENQIVFFNRVPKVGSQSFMELLRRLSIRNNFQFHRDQVRRVEMVRLDTGQQEEFTDMLCDLPTPSGESECLCTKSAALEPEYHRNTFCRKKPDECRMCQQSFFTSWFIQVPLAFTKTSFTNNHPEQIGWVRKTFPARYCVAQKATILFL